MFWAFKEGLECMGHGTPVYAYKTGSLTAKISPIMQQNSPF